jgi:hypothetical protein
MLNTLGPQFFEGMKRSAEELERLVPAAVDELMADRVEPNLPKPKNVDGFLAELQPIEYVG